MSNVIALPGHETSEVIDRVAADPLATATQLEATVALAEWQRQRHLPPAERIVGAYHADVGYEAKLDIVAAEMARAS
ncbi:N-acetylmuramoyl-L-alanine amidase [Nitrobacter winogradskyi]|uniref:Uncharacterized protein n=2 Tax=Nitrobacter winogradskyi TaxID=913 RepID=A0ACC6AEF9_NITWI|nr:N-acetylmuramoyl-L-alanine amidase [Nitrobacter winogradskyi]MCP1998227.1 hypothetical protein [Nitrobacter winogradskyi]GEC15185.1 hypothetical protein NWI01_10770 [Nitrobacter winogradskyi]